MILWGLNCKVLLSMSCRLRCFINRVCVLCWDAFGYFVCWCLVDYGGIFGAAVGNKAKYPWGGALFFDGVWVVWRVWALFAIFLRWVVLRFLNLRLFRLVLSVGHCGGVDAVFASSHQGCGWCSHHTAASSSPRELALNWGFWRCSFQITWRKWWN